MHYVQIGITKDQLDLSVSVIFQVCNEYAFSFLAFLSVSSNEKDKYMLTLFEMNKCQ